MVRLPLTELQSALDRGVALHPESKTCGDFRAPAWMVTAEAEALAAAGAWITPHSAIAKLAGSRAVHLPWKLPTSAGADAIGGHHVVFPASTLCRKGAYELRAAARALGLPLRHAGSVIEGPDFWSGLEVTRAGAEWMDDAALVVMPAFVENRPRRLLAALARGLSVIATPECGLGGLAGVREVPAGDARALAEALAESLAGRRAESASRR